MSYHFLCHLVCASQAVWLTLRGDGEGLRGQGGLPGAEPPDPTRVVAARRAPGGVRRASAAAAAAGPAFVAAKQTRHLNIIYLISYDHVKRLSLPQKDIMKD